MPYPSIFSPGFHASRIPSLRKAPIAPFSNFRLVRRLLLVRLRSSEFDGACRGRPNGPLDLTWDRRCSEPKGRPLFQTIVIWNHKETCVRFGAIDVGDSIGRLSESWI